MLRLVATVALFLIALPSNTQTVDPERTGGVLNGRGWTRMADGSKTFYLVGSFDAISSTCQDNDWKKLFGSSLNFGEVAKALNKFYEEPTNAAIQVTYALTVVKMKAEGASADSIEKATATGRRLAAIVSK